MLGHLDTQQQAGTQALQGDIAHNCLLHMHYNHYIWTYCVASAVSHPHDTRPAAYPPTASTGSPLSLRLASCQDASTLSYEACDTSS